MESNRKFHQNSEDSKSNMLNVIREIKEEFLNKYDENFIIESMMRVSDDLEDLRLYLSNTLINQGKLFICYSK